MAFNPSFKRKACGEFIEDKYSSIKFGSAGYVIEDDLNELQSINMNRSALINRSIRTSGLINVLDEKYFSGNSINSKDSAPVKIPAGSYINVDGYVLKTSKELNIAMKKYLYIAFSEESVYDFRIGGAIKSKRTVAVIEERDSIEIGLEVDKNRDPNDENLYKVNTAVGNIDEKTLAKSPTGYVYFLRIKDDNDNLMYSKIRNNVVEEINSARHKYQPTIKFGRVIVDEDTNKTSSKIGWHGRKNYNPDNNDDTGNFGILADYLWNNNVNDYVEIGDTAGDIVTWENNNKFIDGTAKYATELTPGFTLKSDVNSDVLLSGSNPLDPLPFNGNGLYSLNVSLPQQAVIPTDGTIPESEVTEKDFYNKFTLNSKGVITGAKKATTLSDLGVSEFNVDDAEDYNVMQYRVGVEGKASGVGAWYPVKDMISNLDKNFWYSGDGNPDGKERNRVLKNDPPTETTRLNYNGYFYATKVFNAVYNDYAEYFEKGSNNLEPGDVLEVNDDGKYVKSSSENSKRVVGVYSDTFGHLLGGNGDGNDEKDFVPVGLAGRVNVKVVGDIEPGDLLVSSSIPGVAMKKNAFSFSGTVIGKALEFHSGDSVDRIKMLIMNR